MSDRRRRSLSKISEGKIGVVDTMLLQPSLARQGSTGSRVKPSPRSGGSTPRRKGSTTATSDPDLALILQNSWNVDELASPSPLRRISSETDATDLRKTRRSFESLQSISIGKGLGTRTSNRRGSFDSSAVIRRNNHSRDLVHSNIHHGDNASGGGSRKGTSVEGLAFEERDLEERVLAQSSSARAAMPGRSIASIKKRPKYGVMDAHSKRGITLITQNIALGGRDDANNISAMRKFGITHVLNVAKQMPLFFPGEFVYLKIPLEDTDSTQVAEVMPKASEFISHAEEVKGRVLIHCISGVSRSTTVLLMHLIDQHNICLLDSYNYVRSCRPFIEPNKGFRLQLAQAELNKFGSSSVATKEAGIMWNFYEWNIKKEHVKTMKKGDVSSSVSNHGDVKRPRKDSCLEYFVHFLLGLS